MQNYRTLALNLTGITIILAAIIGLPNAVSSVSPAQESPNNQNSIFLPMVAQSGDATSNNNTNATPTASPTVSPTATSTATPDPAETLSNWWVPNEHLLLWKPTTVAANMNNQVPNQWTLEYDILNLAGLVNNGKEASADAILESFRANPAIDIVEPNYIYTSTQVTAERAPSEFIPNDPRQNEQFAWELLQAYDAWDVTQGDASTVIAVIDTGVDLDHPDLADKLVDGFDFVDRDNQPDDGNLHGTHVAGTAAALTNNALDGAGACPNCSIMPVRALNDEGSGNLADIAAAIVFAANNNADVINMSLGAPARSFILEQAVDRAFQNGAFLTCAAGNENSGVPSFPAAFDNCVSVAATTNIDQRSGFSNFGDTVELAAPGSAILSTSPGGQMTTLDGTSMASPHVAGLAGLLSSLGLSNTEIRTRLCETADAIPGTGQFWQCGRINMLKAVDPNAGSEPTVTPPAATPTDTPTATPSPTSTPTASPTATTPPTVEPNETLDPYGNDPIQDGGFENGDGWTYSDPAIRATAWPISGQYSAALGGESGSDDVIEQTVTVPASGQLSYAWLAAASYGGYSSVSRADRLVLEVELADGSNAAFTLAHPPREEGWRTPTVDLSEFAGQSVTLRFRVQINSGSSTTFVVDDVELK